MHIFCTNAFQLRAKKALRCFKQNVVKNLNILGFISKAFWQQLADTHMFNFLPIGKKKDNSLIKECFFIFGGSWLMGNVWPDIMVSWHFEWTIRQGYLRTCLGVWWGLGGVLWRAELYLKLDSNDWPHHL